MFAITSFICSILPLASFTQTIFEQSSDSFTKVSVSKLTHVLHWILYKNKGKDVLFAIILKCI